MTLWITVFNHKRNLGWGTLFPGSKAAASINFKAQADQPLLREATIASILRNTCLQPQSPAITASTTTTTTTVLDSLQHLQEIFPRSWSSGASQQLTEWLSIPIFIPCVCSIVDLPQRIWTFRDYVIIAASNNWRQWLFQWLQVSIWRLYEGGIWSRKYGTCLTLTSVTMFHQLQQSLVHLSWDTHSPSHAYK